ncbi:MAG: DUF1778 domain-containing protein [Atopobiaceae bacterium]|nr:DUF1778 domain-containing protein [Atopobiaceae bacterium]
MQTSLKKDSRLDLRISSHQKARYEEAAASVGKSLSQWSVSALDSAADLSLEAARLTRLSEETFEAIYDALEQPMPEQTVQLLNRVSPWEK